MSTATATIRRATVDDLPALPGLVVDVTSYLAHDAAGALAGFAVVAFHRGVATVLEITGPADVQGELAAHVLDAQREFFVDAIVIAPRATDLPALARGVYLALGAPRVAEEV